jgi:hypothetical protein
MSDTSVIKRWLLVATSVGLALGQPALSSAATNLLQWGSTWRYLANGFPPSPGWRGTNYDDTAWPQGPAPLGFGEGTEATVIHTGPEPAQLTTYYRRALLLSDFVIFPFSSLRLRLICDDAAAVYINGNEVFRNNLPDGAISGGLPALVALEGANESAFHQYGVWPYYFRPGTNIIAVEIHQHPNGLDDSRFDLELMANLPLALPTVTLLSPTNGSVFSAGPVLLSVSTDDLDGHILQVEYLTNGVPLAIVSVPPFDYQWNTPSAGRYTLSARAVDNSGRSSISGQSHIQVGASTPARLVRGPYLQNASPTHITLCWRTDWFTDSRVLFDTNLENLDQEAADATLAIDHQVQLRNLQPDTKYYYVVGSQSGMFAGGSSYYFVTSPTQSKPTRLWAIGDSGTANANAKAVYDAYLDFAGGRRTDLWLMLGDNAYEAGTDEQYQDAVFDLYPELLRHTVLWPTVGNHDAASSGPDGRFPYLDIFSLPRQGESGGLASGTERYYSFDYANIHLICLDAMTSDRLASGPMLRWLEEDLAATEKDWIIAFWHHPPYTWGTHNSDTERELIEMRENALPILENYGVDLVLCGHSHVYERTWLLNGHYGYSGSFSPSMIVQPGLGSPSSDQAYTKPAGGLGAEHGTVYVVCGCSGEGGVFPFPRHPAMATHLAGYGSMVLDIDGLRMDVRFLTAALNFDDSFTIRKDTLLEPPLNLAARLDGERLRLSWPAGPTPYRLETRLPQPEPAFWLPVPGTPTLHGRFYYLNLDRDDPQGLFRLRRETP